MLQRWPKTRATELKRRSGIQTVKTVCNDCWKLQGSNIWLWLKARNGYKVLKTRQLSGNEMCVLLLLFTLTPTRPSCIIAMLMSPLFYVAAVISLISTRSEGQIKTKVNSIILFISIFLRVLSAKVSSVCLICPEWGIFSGETLSASHTLWTKAWSQGAQKVWLSLSRPSSLFFWFSVCRVST